MKLSLQIVSFLFISMLMLSCSSVSPWERGILAKPEMAWEPDPLIGQLQDHVYFSKEGSSGGYGAGGGGCGCN